jgi:hypothetical protein
MNGALCVRIEIDRAELVRRPAITIIIMMITVEMQNVAITINLFS